MSRDRFHGGGSSRAGWTLLRTVEQAAGAPVDPGGIGTTGTGFSSATGRATVVCAAHTTIVDGIQEQLLRWTVPLTTLYPDFDYRTDSLELGVDLVTFAHGTAEVGVFFGLVDALTVDASLAGGVLGARTAGAGQDQLSYPTATTAGTPTNLGLLIDEAQCVFLLGYDGTNYPIFMSSRVRPEGTTRMHPGIAGPGGTLRGATLADWRVTFGAYHGSTDSLAGITLGFDVYHRRLRRSTGPFL